MPKRALQVLLVMLLLAGSAGAVGLLHDHGTDHSADKAAHCQVCYLLAAATAGVLLSIIWIEIGFTPHFDKSVARCFLPARHDRSWSVSSRGPPLS